MSRFAVLFAILGVLLVLPADARSMSADRQSGSVRVQINVSFFVPGPTDQGEQATKLREHARLIVYQMAGNECAILRQAIANDCRLETLNVNVNIRHGRQQPEGFMVNGSAAYRIVLR